LATKLRQRAGFLRDKLLAELRGGHKIFLFRPADGRLDDPTIERLHAAFRGLSDGVLLCVRNAADGDPATAVAARGGGLLVATMPGATAKLNLGFVRDHRYRHWIALCRAACELEHGRIR